jgi:hypothetical protein
MITESLGNTNFASAINLLWPSHEISHSRMA